MREGVTTAGRNRAIENGLDHDKVGYQLGEDLWYSISRSADAEPM